MARGSRWGLRLGGLALALLFVLSVTYLPHVDTEPEQGTVDASRGWLAMGTAYEEWLSGERGGNPFPIHVDEHIHWVFSATIQRFQSLDHPDPYTGEVGGEEGLTLRGGVHERGFHLALAQLQDLTGVSWFTLFQFGPALWAGLVAVLVWAALDPWPGAPIAAGLTGLMPTSVRFLGPGFLVPIAFGLAWVALVLVLLPRLGRSFRAPALALLTVFWAFFIHVIAGFVALALLLAALPFAAGEPDEEGTRKRLAGISLVAALPMVWLYEAFRDEIASQVAQTARPLDVTVFDQIGLGFLLAWVLGVGLVVYRNPRRRGTQFGAAGVVSLLVLVTILSNFYHGPRLALYDRFHQPFVLLATVPAAYLILATARATIQAGRRGIRVLRRGPPREAGETPDPSSPGVMQGALTGLLVLAFFVGLTSPAVAAHLTEPYYRVLDQDDVDRFQWVESNLGKDYERFLAHPWKAPILTAMTGQQPHTYLVPGGGPVEGEDYVDYVSGTSNDTRWLLERDIEVVVGPRMPDSDAFVEPREGVAVLEEEYANRQEARRGSAPPPS